MLKQNTITEVIKEDPSVQNERLYIDEGTLLGEYFDTQGASSKKNLYERRETKQSVAPNTQERRKGKMAEQKIRSTPGTTIHVIEESEDEIQAINPQQYQKIALSAYETHLCKIEVQIYVFALLHFH